MHTPIVRHAKQNQVWLEVQNFPIDTKLYLEFCSKLHKFMDKTQRCPIKLILVVPDKPQTRIQSDVRLHKIWLGGRFLWINTYKIIKQIAIFTPSVSWPNITISDIMIEIKWKQYEYHLINHDWLIEINDMHRHAVKDWINKGTLE